MLTEQNINQLPLSDKQELINRLVALDGRIVYHDINAEGVFYSDYRSSPLLIVRQVSAPDKDGWVTWSYEFVEDGAIFNHTENLKYIKEDEAKERSMAMM